MKLRTLTLLIAAAAMTSTGCYGTYVRYEHRPHRTEVAVEADAAVDTGGSAEATPAEGDEVDEATFHTDLAPYGNWVDVQEYGSVWVPEHVAVGWEPYTLGHWVYTDDNGWLWVSDESFGWATYHYGRWVTVEGRGWCWVPGRTWGPAWVVWRNGGGYCGWAPLPPVRAGISIDVAIGAIPATHFCFVEEAHLAEPHIREHIVSARENVTIIKKTTHITKVEVVNKRVVNRGVSVSEVEKVSGHRIEHVKVNTVHARGEAGKARGNEVNVYRPEPKARLEPARRPEVRKPTAAEQAAERSRQDEAYAKERKAMDDRHVAERQHRPSGVSEADLAKRHDAEQRQLDEKYHKTPVKKGDEKRDHE